MAGNARFHNKLHRRNHHSASSPGYPDSATDPIASKADPFQGDFFLNGSLSGTGNLVFDGNGTFFGNLSVYGDMTYLETIVTVTSALSVINHGTGPALTVIQAGDQPVARFIDKNDGCSLFIEDNGQITMNTCTPPGQVWDPNTNTNKDIILTINGIVSASGAVRHNTPTAQVVYVSLSGNDNFSGLNPSQAVRTIKKAAKICFDQFYPRKATIHVEAGRYVENNPIYIPAGTTIVGNSLRSVDIVPYNKLLDILWMNNGCYLWGVTFRDHYDPCACTCFPLTLSGSLAYSIAYKTPGYEISTTRTGPPFGLPIVSKPNIVTSPYTQGSSSIARFLTLPLSSVPQSYDYTLDQGVSAIGSMQGLFDIVTEIIYNGAANLPAISSFPVNASSYVLDTLLNNNLNFLKDKVINYVNSNFPNFIYDETKCRRDVGYIIDGVRRDLTAGNSLSSINNGAFYWSGVTSLIPGQTEQTAAAIKELKDVATQLAINAGSFSYDQIEDLVDTIVFIINNGLNFVPPVASFTIPPGASDAISLLTLNKVFLQTEVVSFVDRVFPNFTYDKAKCFRDVGFIIDAITTDLNNGNNSESILAGSSYWAGATSLIPGQSRETIQALMFLLHLIKKVVTNSPVVPLNTGCGIRVDGSRATGFLRSFVTDSFTQFNEGGIGIHIINCGYAQLVSTFTICTTEGVKCESGGNCSISTSNCSFGLSGLVAIGKSTFPVLTGYFSSYTPSGEDYIYVDDVTPRPFTTAYVTNPALTTIPVSAPYLGLLARVYDDPHSAYNKFSNPNADIYYHVVDSVSATPTPSDPYRYRIGTERNLQFPLSATPSSKKYVEFYLRSQIATSSHAFEYIGTGVKLEEAIPALGGQVHQEWEAVYADNGIVYYTSTNESGNFRVGNDFTIVQALGRIRGRAFDRSILALVTPLILGLE